MTKMIPPKGLKEVAVRTERGTKVYKAGRDGLINVDNPRHAKQMKAEGLGVAGVGLGLIVRNTNGCCDSYVLKQSCKECLQRVSTCGKCKSVISPCGCKDKEENNDGGN